MAMTDLPTIQVPGAAVATTVLGFGCSNLLGDKTRAQGLRLLQVAYDAGIRHFDVARYYGFGEAEGLVGELARGRRSDVTITTKFGLQPPARLTRASGLIRGLRRLMRASPTIRALVRRNVHTFVQGGRFDVASARQSLETSLRELGTDYIDFFLLHEGTPADCTPELLVFLEEARTAGKIVAFGVGTTARDAGAICEHAPAFSAVTQFPSSLVAPASVPGDDDRLPAGRRFVVNHGAFSVAAPLTSLLAGSANASERLRRVLDLDAPTDALVAAVLVRAARFSNPHGPIVFSSTVPERIQRNAECCMQPALTHDQHRAVLEILGWHGSGDEAEVVASGAW